MGKTRSDDASASIPKKKLMKSRHSPTQVAGKALSPPSRPEPAEKLDRSTQTCSAEPGSLEEFKDRAETFNYSLQVALKSLSEGRTKPVLKATPVRVDTILECPHCRIAYECKEQPPVCLPCGHSVCRTCSMKIRTRTSLTCPFDFQTFHVGVEPIPTNYLLLQLQEMLNPVSELLCPLHETPVLGYCETDQQLICGVCMFQHKDHNCCSLESEQAEKLKQGKLDRLRRLWEDAKTQPDMWSQWVYFFELNCMSMACSSLGACVNMKLMCYGNGYPTGNEGPDEVLLFEITTQISRLRFLNSQFLEALKTRVSSLEETLKSYQDMTDAEKLQMEVPVDVKIPECGEFLVDFSLLVNRLNYYQVPEYPLVWPAGINQRV